MEIITSCIRCRNVEKSIFGEPNSWKSTPIITIGDSQNAIPMSTWMFQYPDFECHVEFWTVVIKPLRNVSFSNRNFAGIFIDRILASWFALCRQFRTLWDISYQNYFVTFKKVITLNLEETTVSFKSNIANLVEQSQLKLFHRLWQTLAKVSLFVHYLQKTSDLMKFNIDEVQQFLLY